MKNTIVFILFIIFIICLVCLFTNCKFNFYAESFTNKISSLEDYNLLKNASFQSGNDIKQLSENKGDNKIIKLVDNPNCNNSLYVLQQSSKKNITPYILEIPLQLSTYYKLTLWSTDNSKNLINIKMKNNNNYVCDSDKEFNLKQNIINKKIINKQIWYQHEFIFNTPTGKGKTNILIYVGCKPTNKRYITDIVLLPYLPLMKNFESTIGLKSYLDAFNKNSCASGTSLIWNDLADTDNIYKWAIKPIWNSEGYFQTKGNTLTGPSMTDLNIKNEFTIVVYSKSRYNSDIMTLNNGLEKIEDIISTLFVAGNQGTAFNLTIPNDYGKIKLTLGGVDYTTNKNIIPQSEHIYTITYKNNALDIWLDDDENKLQEFKGVPYLYFDDSYFNNKIIINKNKNWDANLHAILIYNRKITYNEIKYINNYLVYHPSPEKSILSLKSILPLSSVSKKIKKIEKSAKPIIKKKDIDDNICPIGYLSEGKYIVYIPKNSKYAKKYGSGEKSYGYNKQQANDAYKNNFQNCKMPDDFQFKVTPHDKCPFIIHNPRKLNPCHSEVCKHVDWTTDDPAKMNLNPECRVHISQYCRRNKYKDPICTCWIPEHRYSEKCQKFRKHFERPEDFGCSVNVFDIQEHPDFKNYIRKDKIPCWNCNLTAPAPKDKIIRRW